MAFDTALIGLFSNGDNSYLIASRVLCSIVKGTNLVDWILIFEADTADIE